MSSFYQPDIFSYDFGTFLDRPNRFVAYVKYNNEIKRCHVPDPGRLKELLLPETKLLLRIPKNEKNYKTFAAVIGVQLSNNHWVSIDSQLANRFVKHEWKNLPVLKEYNHLQSEYSLNKGSRLDFYLHSENRSLKPCLVEVKTVTLHSPENSGIGKFPDAPSLRASKHLKELINATDQGYRTIVLFITPRIDIKEIRPNNKTDPRFTESLFKASEAGVELMAYNCHFDISGIKFNSEIPVNLII